MPVYEYICRECGKKQEALSRSSEDTSVTCCDCGSLDMERLISASYIPSGTQEAPRPRCGNNTTCCGSGVPCEKPPCGH